MMSEVFVLSEASDSAALEGADLVERILEQLEPLIARQRKAVARHGCLRAISSTHLHVLFLLESEGPMGMGRLAELLDVSLPNVTGIVDRMAERGFVERGSDPDDRRVVTIRTASAGREAVEEIDQIRRQTMSRVLGRLTPEQQMRALQTFTDMRAAAEATADAEPHSHPRSSPTSTSSPTPTTN
jgi:DNA-binding MarR family transcriptional regulator